MFPIPIVLIMFRRPELTRRVADAIAAIRPQTLFVVADGPRENRPDDRELCRQTRAIIDGIDWPGAVVKDYSNVNLGCGRRPATGIDWVFNQVDQAIILEDDCVPHPTFFRYCEELLERYRDDERVMHIAGSTYRHEPLPTRYSYAFSQMNAAWGWATWRRAWKHFDHTVKLWPELRESTWLADVLPEPRVERFWAESFDRAFEKEGNVSYWDHQWAFALWAHSGLAAVPRRNLVTNIGCNRDATHCASEDDVMGNIPSFEMPFPLNHPPCVLHSRDMDRQFVRNVVAPRLFPPQPDFATRLNKRMRSLVRRANNKLGLRRSSSPAGSPVR